LHWLSFPHELCRYQLSSAHEADDFSRAVAGTPLAARTLAVTAFLYHFCRRDGLAEAHFAWPEEAQRSLRHNVLWVTQLLVPLAFIVGMAAAEGNTVYYNSLGRFASIAALLLIAAFFVRLLRPSGAIGSFLRARHCSIGFPDEVSLVSVACRNPHRARRPCRRRVPLHRLCPAGPL